MSHSRREVRDKVTVTMVHVVAVGLVKLLGGGVGSEHLPAGRRRPAFGTPVQS